MSARETAFSVKFSVKQLSSLGWGQGLYKPWGVGRGFQGEHTSLAEMLGMIICKEELQVLAGHVLIRREEV